jgi:hypothetical protein
MNCATFFTLAIISGLAALGQGTLTFSNTEVGTTVPGGSPVTDVDHITRLAGAGFSAQLYASPIDDESSLVAVGVPVMFRTGQRAGFVVAGIRVVVPGSPPGSVVFVQMRAWDNGGGAFTTYEAAQASGSKIGKSNIVRVGPLGPFDVQLDPILLGLQPFSLVPEPSAIALGLLGALTFTCTNFRFAEGRMQRGGSCSRSCSRTEHRTPNFQL